MERMVVKPAGYMYLISRFAYRLQGSRLPQALQILCEMATTVRSCIDRLSSFQPDRWVLAFLGPHPEKRDCSGSSERVDLGHGPFFPDRWY